MEFHQTRKIKLINVKTRLGMAGTDTTTAMMTIVDFIIYINYGDEIIRWTLQRIPEK